MGTPATILLVEDDQSMLDGMKDLLELVDIGYDLEVLTAGNGRLGLEVLGAHTPDLIVSDIMMPEMDGYEFLDRVRQNPDWIHIPVIFLTAKGSKQDVHRGRASGADLYITKPFNSNEFLELVHSQLDRAFQLYRTRQQIMNNLKKDILQVLNHEFRTPLTYVTAYYEMLADGLNRVQDQGSFYEYLRGIQVGCQRLTRLVDDFIQVIEIRTGELETRFRAGARPLDDIPALLQRAASAVQPATAELNVALLVGPVPRLPTIYGNADGLVQLFERLLDNAVKFTHRQQRQGGRVEVRWRGLSDRLEVDIVDQGVGFPPQIAERIFELFFQYNRGLMEQQGPGIGLTIARAWAELHGGHIRVQSQEGRGSTFTVALPAFEPGREIQSIHPEARPRLATILIVEDDPHLLIGLQELLEIYDGRYRLQVLTAENGRAGLEVLAEKQPNLIISDIMMPEMEGYEFLRHVRENPNWVQIPFIFLTAKGERQDIHRGWRSGVEEYVTKPYDSDELLDLVVAQLDRHFQMERIMARNFEALKRSILDLITPEFRRPLDSVAQFSADLIAGLEAVETDRELKSSLRGIRSGSERLNRLVEDLISLAELRTGETATAFRLRAEPMPNVSILLYDAAQARMLYAQEQGVTVQASIAADLPPVFGDATILGHSLQRLVEMGIDCLAAEAQAGALRLAASGAGLEVHLSMVLPVPLPPAVRSALRATDATDEGGGLPQQPGVSIIRGVVALHGGRLLFSSDADGAVVTVALPAYRAAPADGQN